jgi:hypothetical protein
MFRLTKTTLSDVTSTVIPLSCDTSKVMVTVGVVGSPSGVATGAGIVNTTSPRRPSVGLAVVTDLMAEVNIDTNDLAGAAASAAGVEVRSWKNPFSC